MGEFFKTFGQGILYVLISPILLVIFALYLVYAIIVYFVMEIASIIYFFSGRNISDEDPETKKLIAIRSAKFQFNNEGITTPVEEVIEVVEEETLEDKEEQE